jgi:hypothetical protein
MHMFKMGKMSLDAIYERGMAYYTNHALLGSIAQKTLSKETSQGGLEHRFIHKSSGKKSNGPEVKRLNFPSQCKIFFRVPLRPVPINYCTLYSIVQHNSTYITGCHL